MSSAHLVFSSSGLVSLSALPAGARGTVAVVEPFQGERVERLLDKRRGPEDSGMQLSDRARQYQRTLEGYLQAGNRPRKALSSSTTNNDGSPPSSRRRSR